MKIPILAVIIVTYNSELFIHKALKCLQMQSRLADHIIIVDSGSKDPSYLLQYENEKTQIILGEKEIGFCRGNNIGMSKLPKNCDYVFFLNPDAFLDKEFINGALAFMENSNNQKCAALTGSVLGYNISTDQTTGKYDTTGVFRSWYGKWFDRDQGIDVSRKSYSLVESIPAISGAVFFCRKKALDQVLIRSTEVFDNTFYMYKEDIDLSLRLKNAGWNLFFVPYLISYHCRGWSPDRSKMARKMRLCSSKNELRIQSRQKKPLPILYSTVKHAAVLLLDI
jgi:N-acetylglucosaminyl-diphospho-decaprenol L-rhamnosyltransferase